MTEQIPWAAATLGVEEVEEVVATLRSGWLTAGPKVRLFEEQVAERVGAEAAFAVTSCTAALHLALLALDIGAGQEVVTTTLTCPATANVVVRVGARPVLVDVEDDTLNLDPHAVAAALTPATKAIIAVHYAGHPCRLHELRTLADQHGIALIEDAAHAIGATYRGTPIGGTDNLTAFSFYANKVITTGEGGMLTGPRTLIDHARLLGRHGIDRDVWTRKHDRGTAWYDVTAAGLKYGMNDIQASLGIHQLPRLDTFIARRTHIANTYTAALTDLPGLHLPTTHPDVQPAWHLYTLRITNQAPLTRDQLIHHLTNHNISSALQFRPLSQEPYYRDGSRHHRGDRAAEESLSLPLHPGLTDEQVAEVVRAVRAAWAGEPTATEA